MNSSTVSNTTSNSSTLEEIPIETYLESNTAWAVIYILVLSVTILIGICGNVLIIACYALDETLKVSGRGFVINMAVCDLYVVAIAEPMCIIGATTGGYYINKIPGLCQLVASSCLAACFAAIMSLGLLTLNRYVIICHRGLSTTLFTKHKTILMIVCAWIVSVCVELPNFIGDDDHSFDTVTHQCIWKKRASEWYKYFVVLGLVLLPLILMLAAYCGIFWAVMKSSNKVHEHISRKSSNKVHEKMSRKSSNKVHERISKQNKMNQWKKSRTLVFVVISFLICWTPYCTVILIDLRNELPGWIYMWTTLLVHTHAAANIIIYVTTSERHRIAYHKMLLKWYNFFKYRGAKISDDPTHGLVMNGKSKPNTLPHSAAVMNVAVIFQTKVVTK